MKSGKRFTDVQKIIDNSSLIEQVSDQSVGRSITVKNVPGSLRALIISSLWQKLRRRFFIIVPTREEADDWYHDLNLLINPNDLALLVEPKSHVRYEAEKLDDRLVWLIDGLSLLSKKGDSIAIATPDIFTLEVPEPENIEEFRTTLKRGQSLDFENFIKELSLHGFDRKDFVSTHGDFAVRGGILDIYPFGWDNPFRLEFWGNDIDSIREFETLSQRSIREHPQVEFIANIFHSEQEHERSSIYRYLDKDITFIIDSPDIIESNFKDFELPGDFKKIIFNKLGSPDVQIQSSAQPSFNSSVHKLLAELRRLAALDTRIFLCAEGKIHLTRLRELMENAADTVTDEINETMLTLAPPEQTLNSIQWLDQTPSQGFVSEDFRLAVFTEHQVFNRIRSQDTVRTRKQRGGGISLRELKQLKVGDYVVHVDKGIARFEGFERVTMGGSFQDCVRLTFAEGDVLYVNLNYIQKVQKYSAQEGVVPKLSKLGSSEWLRKKARTKKRLKDIARDLIKLYAIRKMQPGFPYPPDTIWQKEFEASFIYEDTPDQARTTSEVKDDMQDKTPMDRLVCGDVGFGKTEIAIRAAFKAVQAGKQTAILVPTTILAQQHYMTFKDRLNRYPVMIEALSRFRSAAEQKKILDRTKEGKVDILIGTHRILSKDVEFRDLGLLIIDEEHRFGVGAKEKLRQLRANVDTLTLTATPIPRTLNFSLMGARDLSVIETPPRNRLPIHTEILEWHQDSVVKAINTELERGGQVFFVTDRIDDTERLERTLKMLLPTVRIGVAHGQMNPSELERVMEKFVSHKFDLLITTKIVESGLDIPSANTMLINHSHNFGLAELYQLRGRVGRSNAQAYCYLIIPPVKALGTTALRRLQAIEEYTELGSGFQLAMRDMEIRGAGNLLGPEQSGFINEIGFELFHKVLDEAVTELRTEEFADLFKDAKKSKKALFDNEDITIELGTDALLPADYIASDTERFYFYKLLYNVQANEELNAIRDEIQDRFGKMPQQARELMFAVKVRIAALDTGFTKVIIKNNKLTAEFPPESATEYYEKAFPYIAEYIPELESTRLKQFNKKLFLEAAISSRDEAVEILWRIKKQVESASE